MRTSPAFFLPAFPHLAFPRLALFSLALALPMGQALTQAHAQTATETQTQTPLIATSVTLYPAGAEIILGASAAFQAGKTRLILSGLPATLDPAALRVQPPKGVRLLSLSMQETAPSLPAQPSARALAAQAQLEARRRVLTDAQLALDLASAALEAAEAQASLMQRLSPDTQAPEAVATLAQLTGEQVLAARTAAAKARAALPPLVAARDQAAKDLALAETTASELADSDQGPVLIATFLAAEEVTGDLQVTGLTDAAGWTPTNDWFLTTGDDPSLRLDRGALIRQETGQDWSNVRLTLSTALPGDQIAASQLWPQPLRLMDQADPAAMGKLDAGLDRQIAAASPAPEMLGGSFDVATPVYQGDIVSYQIAEGADLASGNQTLRIALDEITFDPDLTALAVPAQDTTAFALAEFVNTGSEVILPAEARLYRDGNLMGQISQPGIAAGDKAKLSFGRIDSLRLAFDQPRRSTGERGFLSSSTEASEETSLRIRNLGDQAWNLRVLHAIPYSEDEALSITLAADPAPTSTDPDGQRGILVWDFPLAGGDEKTISVTHRLTWPEGKILQ